MITFASDRIKEEWTNASLNQTVKLITTESANYAKSKYDWDYHLTSIYRTPEEDAALGGTGIHVAWRAVDVRSNTHTQAQIDDVTNFINSKWIYDPERPEMKVCFSDPHGSGPHLHFQSHPHTIPVILA